MPSEENENLYWPFVVCFILKVCFSCRKQTINGSRKYPSVIFQTNHHESRVEKITSEINKFLTNERKEKGKYGVSSE